MQILSILNSSVVWFVITLFFILSEVSDLCFPSDRRNSLTFSTLTSNPSIWPPHFFDINYTSDLKKVTNAHELCANM